jgi:subtilase family serine protease
MQINSRWGRFGRSVFVFLACTVTHASFAQTPVRDRVVQGVDNSQMTMVKGNIHPLARARYDQGNADPSMPMRRMTMTFRPSPRQQADLDTLLAAQQDRGSPDYHRWLTPEQFGSRFGMSQSDLNKVTGWLESQGFTIEETPASRNSISFSGTAQQAQSAFRTEIHRYAVGGEPHYANATEPSIPAAFAGVVTAIRGLDDFRPKPRALKKAVRPRFTSGQTGNHFVTPGDFATIYDLNHLYSQGTTGAGQNIAVAGQSDFVMSDVQAFRNASGLSANNPQVVLVPGSADPGILAGDVDEASLDVEWSGAVAPNATIIFVNSTNVFVSLQYAIQQGLTFASVLSISYGDCEQNFDPGFISAMSALAQQANAQGQTIVAPSGDSGAADCDGGTDESGNPISIASVGLAVDFPGSLPYVTSVGGTEFGGDVASPASYWLPPIGVIPNAQDVNPSALQYIPEIAWNDTSAANGLAAGGGGASVLFSKPTWQVDPGVPNDGARDVPDISFDASPAHDAILFCSENQQPNGTFTPSCVNGSFRDTNGNLDTVGGTSAGVPALAGIVALINQYTSSAGQGNINTVLYPLFAHAPAAFHDISVGANQVPFQSSAMSACGTAVAQIGYGATVGYDLATGLGSIDAFNLVTSWTSVARALSSSPASAVDFQLAFSGSSVTIRRGSCAAVQLQVVPLKGFSGIPAFSCVASNTLGTTQCSVTPVAGSMLYEPGRFNDRVIAWWAPAVTVLVCLLGLTLVIMGGKQPRRRPWPKLVPGFALVTLVAIALGCGSSNSSSSSGLSGVQYAVIVQVPTTAPAVSGAIQVTGSIAGLSHSVQLAVTAN